MTDAAGATHQARTVILATGSGEGTRHRLHPDSQAGQAPVTGGAQTRPRAWGHTDNERHHHEHHQRQPDVSSQQDDQRAAQQLESTDLSLIHI